VRLRWHPVDHVLPCDLEPEAVTRASVSTQLVSAP
jgi:hypothetical protein